MFRATHGQLYRRRIYGELIEPRPSFDEFSGEIPVGAPARAVNCLLQCVHAHCRSNHDMREAHQIFSCLVTWLSSAYGTKVATLDGGQVVFRGG